MGTTAGGFTPIPAADNAKAIAAYAVVVPAAGTAQTVNPVDNHNSVTVMNFSNVNFVRATITLVAGVTGDATAAQQVQLVPPGGSISLDLQGNPTSPAGNVDAIDSVKIDVVAFPAATAELSTLPALAVNAGAQVGVNFATK